MSKLITDTIRHTGGSADNITLDGSQNATIEGNLTVDGTTTLTGAVTLPDDTVTSAKIADNAISRPLIQDNAINTDKITDGSVNEAKLLISNSPTNGQFLSAQSGNTGGLTWAAPAAGGGIDNAVVFRKTADTTGNCLPVTDWEKEDGLYLPGEIGTFAAPSSGVFTFPSTGYWYVIATMTGVNSGSSVSNSMYVQIMVTIDNGSYWSPNSISYDAAAVSGHASATTSHLLDVTDLSNDKVKINLGAAYGSEVFKGSTTMNMSHVTFIRLGDT